MKTVPVILAGGIGERFWPLSRSSMPKQLLSLTSNKTLIEETFARVKDVSSADTRPLVITGRACADKIRATLGRRFSYDSIVEPVGKNTAPAVGLAAAWVRRRYGDAVMLVASADHAISPKSAYVKAVRAAVACAQARDTLVVFGIRPQRPDTGYGYINIGKSLPKIPGCVQGRTNGVQCFTVRRFVEKPTLAVARQYLKSGKYLWNSGMFVWKASVILDEFRQHMPGLYKLIMAAEKSGFSKRAIETFYATCEKQSIDFGIMEKSFRIAAVCGTFFWDDIGSWESMTRVHKANKAKTVAVGKNIFEFGNTGSIIYNASNRSVASIGLNNVAVVVTPDAVLAIARPLLPDLKKYLGLMKENNFPKDLF
jgi:mannose-1-phosphate guanylyltransferase